MVMVSWRKVNYSQRLFLGLVGYSVILLGCVLLYQYQREREFKAAELNSQLQLINQQLLHQIESGDADLKMIDTGELKNLRISVINPLGKVVFDNSLEKLPESNHLGRKEIVEARKNGSGYALQRHSESTGGYYFYSARKGKNGMIVRTAVPYSVSLNAILQADKGFLWFIGILSIIMCTLGYFATRREGQHIRRLRNFAEKAEKGIKIYDDEPFPHDELGDISHHIVRLYASLQQALSERDRAHNAVLHEQREKERIKKQLTNNINHELKTPVASMQVCFETLLNHPDMSEEKRREFISRGFAHNQRLSQLLSDVSLITRMDDGAMSITKEPIDLTEIIGYVVTEKKAAAEKNGIIIVNEVMDVEKIDGNRHLLESVFFNLIDNAISYSGGSRITIRSLQSNSEQIIIAVSDDGIGVSEEHLPRLFERFYRVDKGRSRAAGGTGLGLSIVKNAVRMHGGEISVSNRTQGGLIFRIVLSRTS